MHIKAKNFLFLIFSFCLFVNKSFASDLPKKIQTPLNIWKLGFENKIAELDPNYGGGAIAVLYRDEIIYEKYYGVKRKGAGKIDKNSIFRIASVSKSIVAATLAQETVSGRISIDDSMASVIPGIDKRVTLRHILSHSSGYGLFGEQQIKPGMKKAEWIKKLIKEKSNSTPGSLFNYNNFIFSLSEEFLTSKMQMNWRKAVSHFLTSLNINDFSICENPSTEKYAFPHIKTKNGYAEIKETSPYVLSACASGGLYLSQDGMIKYLRALMGRSPSALSDKARELLFKPYIKDTKVMRWPIRRDFPKENYQVNYSLGIRVIENVDSPLKMIFHPGYLTGSNSFIGFIPDLDIGVIILTTQDGWEANQQGFNFWEEIVKESMLIQP